MTIPPKPDTRPVDPRFSAGPTRKRPGWTPDFLENNPSLGRSHRSAQGRKVLGNVIDTTREVLEVPSDYRIAIVPASDTGAVEMALWSMLGPRGVDVAAWETFGYGWITDAEGQLPLEDLRIFRADYGRLPQLYEYTGDRDLVFTWNGTTAGVRVPNAGFIPADREGVTICDATSAVFAQQMDWPKLDVLTYSWQKNMGGEAAHGMIILSPRAVERLESYSPPWPMPKIFRMTRGGSLDETLFEGFTINTPSLMCAEDHLDTLNWVKAQGGLQWMHDRADSNAQVLWDWMDRTDWIDNLAEKQNERSNTGVCMKIVDPRVTALPKDKQAAFANQIVKLLGDENVAYDFGSHRAAPAGFRIWASGLIEKSDLEALIPWLEWAFETVAAEGL
ncbi:MAG: phosphoserine transaminase [Hyphomonadaceae bacterium]|nr:phosphoserine transaminase [Hyphomonadaceae bacterium]